MHDFSFPGEIGVPSFTPAVDGRRAQLEWDSDANGGKTVFVGDVDKNGERTGEGVMVWRQGTREERDYHGSWEGGKANGYGALSNRPGKMLFRGFFEDNRKEQGVLISMKFEVTRYIGELRDEQPHGLGICYAKNRDRFVGHFKAGIPSGLGALVTQNKKSYGDFRAWKEHGHCTVTNT